MPDEYARRVGRERGLSNQHEALITAKEAAELLGVRTATIYAYASRGLLGPGARGPGTRARYPRSLVETLRVKAAARAGHAAVAAAALRWGEPVLDSAITRISPRGPVYRGRRAIDLVDEPFEKVAEWLWGTPVDWSARTRRVATKSARPSVHTFVELVLASTARPPERGALLFRLACAAGRHEVMAERAGSIAEAFLTSLRGRRPRREEVRWINAALVLIADHELNASTFAARVAASARAPWLDCVLSALGAATGVRHAAACDAAEAMWRAKALPPLEGQLPGFDVGAYPGGDPRAERLLSMLRPALSARQRTRLDALLSEVERATGQLPAVDLAFAVLSTHLRLPAGSSTVLFGLGRMAGWLAHIDEQLASADSIRPRARYVGQ